MQRKIKNQLERRQAFSLIEMLVVISIIATLFSIGFAVVSTSIHAANVAATRATITKVDSLLRDQLRGFDRQMGHAKTIPDLLTIKDDAKSGFPQRGGEFPSWPAGNDIYDSSELLYLILTDGRVTGSTPVDEDSFDGDEVADSDGDGLLELIDAWGNPLRFYRWPTRYLNPFGYVSTQIDNGGAAVGSGDLSLSVVDSSGFDNVLSSVRNTSNQGLANASIFVVIGDEIIEVTAAGFGTVIRGVAGTTAESHHDGATVKLAPFPQLVNLMMGSLSVRTASYDPDDPRGSLTGLSPPVFEDDFHTLDSYHSPLIVSAGPDGEVGLEEPFEVPNYGYLAAPDTGGGSDVTAIVNPSSTFLGDNITNLGGGN